MGRGTRAKGDRRPATGTVTVLLAATICGTGLAVALFRPGAAQGPALPLTAAEVDAVVRSAVTAVDDATMAVAVSDRAGRVLAVFRKPAASGEDAATALGLARTAAFFSNDQAPLSSRTVRTISGIHFPPGIRNTPNAALYGIENTNRGCDLGIPYLPGQAFPPATALGGGVPGAGIVTGKADLQDSDPRAVNPGGVPIYKDGRVVGGVGVAGVAPARAEFAAFTASLADPAFGPRPAPPGAVFVDGIRLPFVLQQRPAGAVAGVFAGAYDFSPTAGGAAPEAWLAGPLASAELSATEVQGIIDRAVATAGRTRAVIRLPHSSRARMVIAVGDLEGNILGLYRMPDATVFSVDVAVTKARNVVYFSSPTRALEDLPGVPPGTAVTNRTISFGAQPLFPPGIDGTAPGPFYDLFLFDTANPCTQGRQPANPNQSGIVFFPGSVPLYRAGALVGGLGVSGDGVDQDDYVAAAGAQGFEAPPAIRADRIVIRGVRLPYLKFPRNPEQ